VTFSPLGKGFLTGTISSTTSFSDSDVRKNLPRFTEEARAANQALVDLLTDIAERKKVTNAQVALAWLLAQHPSIVPIPGTTKINRLDENVAAADVALTPEDLQEITAAADRVDLQGDRYPENMQRWINR
jgi:aryl-alcohol dehydrogenase-like predicted oxidoreductase